MSTTDQFKDKQDDWSIYGIPTRIVVNNQIEFNSVSIEELARAINIIVVRRPINRRSSKNYRRRIF